MDGTFELIDKGEEEDWEGEGKRERERERERGRGGGGDEGGREDELDWLGREEQAN